MTYDCSSGMSGLWVGKIMQISNKAVKYRMVAGLWPVRCSSLLDTSPFYWTFLSSTTS